MALGDAVVVASTSVANGSSLTIQPGSGIEWIIHNVYVPEGSAIEVYATDGSNAIKFDSNPSGGFRQEHWHLTNAQYFTIKNVSGSSIYMKYDGIITKST